jgi:hypothetical protein
VNANRSGRAFHWRLRPKPIAVDETSARTIARKSVAQHSYAARNALAGSAQSTGTKAHEGAS